MPEKILPSSSLNWTLTNKQIRAITRLAIRLGITDIIESTPRNRREARNLIYELRNRVKEMDNPTFNKGSIDIL